MAEDTGSNTVAVGGFEITSNHESADDMVKALTPPDKEAEKQPVIIKPIPEKTPDAKLSKAAAKLGAAGGKAAAEARARREEEQEPPADGAVAADAGTDESVEEKPVGKPKDDPIARMRQATAENARIKRERDQAIAELQRLRYQAPPQEQTREEAPRVDPNAPPFKWDDFETPEEYIAAYYTWQNQRQAIAYQEQAAVNAYAAQLDQALGAFNQRCAEVDASKIAPEIRELQCSAALEPNEQIGPENVIADEIIQSENAPALMLYLTEHPDDFQRLMTLPSPQHIAREFMKLEARVEAGQTGTVTTKGWTPAKPPVRPVTGSPIAADPFEVSDEMSDDEWLRRSQAKQKAQSARR